MWNVNHAHCYDSACVFLPMAPARCSLLAAVLLAAVHLQAVTLNDLTPWQQGASLRPHPKGCPPGWLWVSAQQWWQIEPAEVPLMINSSLAKDSGHIHNEFCWPQGLPIAGKFSTRCCMH